MASCSRIGEEKRRRRIGEEEKRRRRIGEEEERRRRRCAWEKKERSDGEMRGSRREGDRG